MASRFGHGETNDEKFKGVERPKEVKALYYWNFLENDYDDDDVQVIIKPIDPKTPMPEDLPVGLYPDGKDGEYKFAAGREVAMEFLDYDRRFVMNTEIGGMRVDDLSF
jgi:hypothetical protein